ADGEDLRSPRAPGPGDTALHFNSDGSDYRWCHREFRDAGRSQYCRTWSFDRFRGTTRDRADDSTEVAGGLSAFGIPARTWNGRRYRSSQRHESIRRDIFENALRITGSRRIL